MYPVVYILKGSFFNFFLLHCSQIAPRLQGNLRHLKAWLHLKLHTLLCGYLYLFKKVCFIS